MGALKPKLPGNTLPEIIVASILFLAVFAISLETLTRLTVRDDEGLTYVEADRRIGECRREFSDGLHPVGIYEKVYDWGGITASIAPYRDYTNVQELTLVAAIRENRKHIEYKYLIEIPEEF